MVAVTVAGGKRRRSSVDGPYFVNGFSTISEHPYHSLYIFGALAETRNPHNILIFSALIAF